MKKYLKVFVSLLVVLSLTACGHSRSDSAVSNLKMASTETFAESAAYDMGYDGGYEYYTEEAVYADDVEAPSENVEIFNDSARKLIKTYNLNVETEFYDDFSTELEARISSMGGYIQDMNEYNGSSYRGSSSRYLYLTARIPTVNLDAFVSYVGSAANVTNKTLSVEDVTLQYVDVESRKESLEIEQERLLALLEKAESIDDIIALESRLSEVRYKLETQASQLRTYDNLVDYATVYINLEEVTKYTEPEPESYGERISRAFREGVENVWRNLQNFFENFVYSLPGIIVFLVVAGIVVAVIILICKLTKKRRLIKKEKRAESLMNCAKETAAKKAEENAGKF